MQNYGALFRMDRSLPVLFFSALLILGFAIYDDYGISWDEPLQRSLGLATWDYVSGKNTSLLTNDNCYLNPLIGLLEVLPEKILKPNSERAMYLSRHLFNFLFCWIGLIFFYLLALRIFRDYRYALLSCLLFILTPRLFAHCFYNSKDLPFLFLFVASIYLFVCWLERPSWYLIILMLLISGMLTGARMAGLLFPLIVAVTTLFSLLNKQIVWKNVKMIVAYGLLYPAAVYLFFPTFWVHPWSQFEKAFSITTRHPYEVTTFFMGITVHSLHSPWYYIPVWMAITIPLGWWFFFLTGFTTAVVAILKNGLKSFSFFWITVFLWLFLPLIAVIAFHSSVYDDGRHLFFIYPAFLLIAVSGIQFLFKRSIDQPVNSRLLRLFGAFNLLFTISYLSVFMVGSHPFQYVYFNAIGRKYAADYFEKDYWGLSYRNALEFLVRYDQSNHINVRWKVDPCEWNLAWLNDDDRSRFHQSQSFTDCDYYITNYRTNKPRDASDYKIYDLKVQGITIMAIYKMHPPNAGTPP